MKKKSCIDIIKEKLLWIIQSLDFFLIIILGCLRGTILKVGIING